MNKEAEKNQTTIDNISIHELIIAIVCSSDISVWIGGLIIWGREMSTDDAQREAKRFFRVQDDFLKNNTTLCGKLHSFRGLPATVKTTLPHDCDASKYILLGANLVELNRKYTLFMNEVGKKLQVKTTSSVDCFAAIKLEGINNPVITLFYEPLYDIVKDIFPIGKYYYVAARWCCRGRTSDHILTVEFYPQRINIVTEAGKETQILSVIQGKRRTKIAFNRHPFYAD